MYTANHLHRSQVLMVAIALFAGATSRGDQASSNDSFDKAIPLTCPFDISAELSTAAERDFYSVADLPVGSLDLIWSGGDRGLRAVVYDDWGRWVGYVGQTASRSVILAFTPRRHYIEVYSEDGVTHGNYRIQGQSLPLGPQRDGGRLRLNFDSPGEPFVARSLIPLVAQRMEVELAPYSCTVVTSQELAEQQTIGEWVRVRVGAGRSLGNGGWGDDRRPNGICGSGWTGAGAEEMLWQTLYGWPMADISHESRHGFGIPHWGITSSTRLQLDPGAMLIADVYWSKIWNLREYMTMICQAGYFGVEIEPNNDLSTPTDVNLWLEQMRKDNLQTNNAFVASGRISDGSDVDIYSLTIRGGEKWQFDIDAAEFQYPLDAQLEVLRANDEVLAQSDDATDPDSGIFCADPSIRVRFPATEIVYLRVSGLNGTLGGYHLIGKPEACFDKTGPRICGVLPDARSAVESTGEVFVYFNEELDRQSLNSANIHIVGAATGPVPVKIIFDPLKCLLRLDAEHPLEPDIYTLTLSGLADCAGNLLDGETDGSFAYPEISGDGLSGGDFLYTFRVSEPAPLLLADRFWLDDRFWEDGFGHWLVFRSSVPMATASIIPENLAVRNNGPDGHFDTRDDHLFPLLCWNWEVLVGHPTIKAEIWVWMTATLPPGDYRCDYNLKDAAGRPVQGSIPFNFTTWPAGQGPRIVRVSPNPDIPHAGPVEQITVQFSGAMNPATITPETFHVLYSSTGAFFHGNDIPIADADGIIEYDPVEYSATFRPADTMGPGFYRVELSGRRGRITDIDGHLLDGEYLAAGIYKCDEPSVRTASPSGNMEEGGDYAAVIVVETPMTR